MFTRAVPDEDGYARRMAWKVSRSRWKLFCAAICAAAASGAFVFSAGTGCKNEVIIPPGEGGSGGSSSESGTFSSGSIPKDGGADGFDAFIDPGCKNTPPPIEDFHCDPYDQGNGDCGPGDACYIYVQYPDEPCGQEVYGAVCAPAGPGGQGDPCDGPTDCQAGTACVVTGSGTQCVVLCPLTGPSGCPGGTVCEPIDVQGFGGCL